MLNPNKRTGSISKLLTYPPPIYHNGLILSVADRGVAACFDAKTGEELWTERLGGDFYSSPILVGDRMLCINLTGYRFHP